MLAGKRVGWVYITSNFTGVDPLLLRDETKQQNTGTLDIPRDLHKQQNTGTLDISRHLQTAEYWYLGYSQGLTQTAEY